MGEKIEAFYEQMDKAVYPSLEWTKKDAASLWNTPISKWGDYFSLKKAKREMAVLYARQQVVRKMPKIVPLYIKSIQRGFVLTADYLQAYGDVILNHFVRKHFRRKYGLNSQAWKDFSQKEEQLWQNIVDLRKARKEEFVERSIMSLDKIPEEVRKKIVRSNPQDSLRKTLESYYRYQDGENRDGKKMPFGLKPPPTTLVRLEKMSENRKTKERRKPLPKIQINRHTER